MPFEEMKDLLDGLNDRLNTPAFVENDPVSITHSYHTQEDREIAGFLTATIAWGNRKAIIANARRLMHLMGDEPARFVREASDPELVRLGDFVHRTFNGSDCICFVRSLRHLCSTHGGIGEFVQSRYEATGDLRKVLSEFRSEFFRLPHPGRTEKHFSSIDSGSACKRLNLYFKWMVRRDAGGVDLGLWERIPARALFLPLDVHAGNVARALGLLVRRQNDWKAVEEITEVLRRFDPDDPVKYDFALFGAGVYGLMKNTVSTK